MAASYPETEERLVAAHLSRLSQTTVARLLMAAGLPTDVAARIALKYEIDKRRHLISPVALDYVSGIVRYDLCGPGSLPGSDDDDNMPEDILNIWCDRRGHLKTRVRAKDWRFTTVFHCRWPRYKESPLAFCVEWPGKD